MCFGHPAGQPNPSPPSPYAANHGNEQQGGNAIVNPEPIPPPPLRMHANQMIDALRNLVDAGVQLRAFMEAGLLNEEVRRPVHDFARDLLEMTRDPNPPQARTRGRGSTNPHPREPNARV